MAQAPETSTALIESDRVEGMAVYSGERTQIGAIKRLIIRPRGLTDQEKSDLVEYLKSL